MKIIVLGLHGAIPELLFDNERLATVRHLMQWGAYGELAGVIPPGPVPTWSSFVTSLDPGTLGLFRRTHLATARPAGRAIWEVLARSSRRSIVIGLASLLPFEHAPPSFTRHHPAPPLQESLEGSVERAEALFRASEQLFAQAEQALANQAWSYLQIVDPSLMVLQRAFWHYSDPEHPRYTADPVLERVIPDYYELLDARLERLLGLLDDEAIVLIAAPSAAHRLDGSLRLNEWLRREGLLVLTEQPTAPTRPTHTLIDRSQTRAWFSGGPYPALYIVRDGREALAEQIRERLVAMVAEHAPELTLRFHEPETLYRTVPPHAPALLVDLGSPHWRAVDSVGHTSLVADARDPRSPGCVGSAHGSFVLAAGDSPLAGELHGVGLLDLAPTLLDLGGYEIPESMLGESLGERLRDVPFPTQEDEEAMLLDRLKGLGYVE